MSSFCEGLDQRKEIDMTKRIGRSGLLAAASLVAAASFAFAHDPAKSPAGKTDMMNGCGEHHSAAMKASDEVSMHLAEAKRSTTLAEMRNHVEMADKAMAEMKSHMSMCMEMMGKTHEGTTGGAMMGSGTTPTEKTAGKVVDPVCNMEVANTKTAPTAVYKGTTYYFCSEEDKARFQKNPEQYAGKKP
jgi:YHS domain-containing protein